MPANPRTPLNAFVTAALLAGVIAVSAGLLSGPALAGNGKGGNNNDGLDTPADTIHPNIHQNNNEGNNANPNGNNPQSGNFADGTGGGNMHGIGNTPGQLGINPNDDGVSGFANQLNTVHGGIGAYNPQIP